jgi:hypothetical protein
MYHPIQPQRGGQTANDPMTIGPARERQDQRARVRVELGSALRAAVDEIRHLSLLGWLVAVALELAGTLISGPGSGFLGYVAGVAVAVLAQGFVIALMLDATAAPPRSSGRLALRRYPAMVGFEVISEVLLLGLFLGVVIAVLIAAIAMDPTLLKSGGTIPASDLPAVIIAALIILIPFAYVLGRWICARALVVDREDGPVAAIRRSWGATKGAGIRCGLLYFVTRVPGFLDSVAPAATRVPVAVVTGVAGLVAAAALSVVLYRRLFPALRQSYPVTEAGRLDFEADAAILLRQGYAVAASHDDDGVRQVTFGPAGRLVAISASSLVPLPVAAWTPPTAKLPLDGLITRYENWRVRRATPRIGADRARREIPALARFNLALLIWIAPTFAARFLGADIQLASYGFALAWSPVVYLTWRTYQRARKP